jgi:hypothetical protein
MVAEIEGVERRRRDTTGTGRGHAPYTNRHVRQYRCDISGA